MSDGTHVVVIGSGVAGVAAAFAAQAAGARVTVVSDGSGASRFMSGAVDERAWELDDPALFPLRDAEVAHVLSELGLWRAGDERSRVATPWGIVRSAYACDRAVLNLASMHDAHVAVLRVNREGWDAELLSNAWQHDPWCSSRRIGFHPIEVPFLEAPDEAFLSDAELAALLDDPARLARLAAVLRDRVVAFDAVLLGPWLGIDGDAAGLLRTELGYPVGETLSFLASSAGARFDRAAGRLFDRLGVVHVHARVLEIAPRDAQYAVRCEGEPTEVLADAVVLACGGLAGGGVHFDPADADLAGEMPVAPRAPFRLSFASPAIVGANGHPSGFPGSMQGLNLEAFDWPAVAHQASALERVSVLASGPQCFDAKGLLLRGIFVAGEVASNHPAGMLSSLRSGLAAGRAAASIRG